MFVTYVKYRVSCTQGSFLAIKLPKCTNLGHILFLRGGLQLFKNIDKFLGKCVLQQRLTFLDHSVVLSDICSEI